MASEIAGIVDHDLTIGRLLPSGFIHNTMTHSKFKIIKSSRIQIQNKGYTPSFLACHVADLEVDATN
jgi:hypothetical protein